MKHRKKKVLALSIICFTIAAIALAGLVHEITWAYYSTERITIQLQDGMFPPKHFNWKYHERFKYQPWKKTINC